VDSIRDRLTTDGLIDKFIRGHMISVNLPTQESGNCHVYIREYTNVFSEKDETFQRRPETCPIHTLADDFLEYVRLKSVEYDVQHVFAGGELLHFHYRIGRELFVVGFFRQYGAILNGVSPVKLYFYSSQTSL
jgi:hypothetical protein